MNAFFLFKRLVGYLLKPLPLTCLLFLLGFSLLAFGKRRRNAVVCLALAFLVLFASSFPPLVRLAALPLESMHRPFNPENPERHRPRAVVVLGQGVAHPGDAAMPAITRLSDTARARLVEGVRVWRLYPETTLVTSGFGMGLESCADAMALAAAELGVPTDKIRRLSESLDTEDEARLVAERHGGGEVVLVTSAVHMPRSVAYFTDRGVSVIPAPCDYIGAVSGDARSAVNRRRWLPTSGSLGDSGEIWHEAMGLLYRRLFGKGRATD